MRTWLRAIMLGAIVMRGLASCSSKEPDAGPSCPRDLPASCPLPTPSFASQVQPIIQSRCFPCHTTGGIGVAEHDFSTYNQIVAQRREILDQFYACKMPPEDAGQPTVAEREALLGWLVCKAPNN